MSTHDGTAYWEKPYDPVDIIAAKAMVVSALQILNYLEDLNAKGQPIDPKTFDQMAATVGGYDALSRCQSPLRVRESDRQAVGFFQLSDVARWPQCSQRYHARIGRATAGSVQTETSD